MPHRGWSGSVGDAHLFVPAGTRRATYVSLFSPVRLRLVPLPGSLVPRSAAAARINVYLFAPPPACVTPSCVCDRNDVRARSHAALWLSEIRNIAPHIRHSRCEIILKACVKKWHFNSPQSHAACLRASALAHACTSVRRSPLCSRGSPGRPPSAGRSKRGRPVNAVANTPSRQGALSVLVSSKKSGPGSRTDRAESCGPSHRASPCRAGRRSRPSTPRMRRRTRRHRRHRLMRRGPQRVTSCNTTR